MANMAAIVFFGIINSLGLTFIIYLLDNINDSLESISKSLNK